MIFMVTDAGTKRANIIAKKIMKEDIGEDRKLHKPNFHIIPRQLVGSQSHKQQKQQKINVSVKNEKAAACLLSKEFLLTFHLLDINCAHILILNHIDKLKEMFLLKCKMYFYHIL
ncbi:Protein of unknown function [Gryllus bimaculatus]|nr:Protein of unknown function [Gryllus bimaculatus]